jgi:hypothetical protein
LDARDEFFLCIVKLRHDKEDVELGFLFGISSATAGLVFNIWLNFLYFQFKDKELAVETFAKDRRVASKRAHAERVIGLAKTYKILQNKLGHSRTPVEGRIIFVCFVLSNLPSNMVPKYA